MSSEVRPPDSRQPPTEGDESACEARLALARWRLTERLRVGQEEHERERLDDELRQVLASPGRRRLLAFRRLLLSPVRAGRRAGRALLTGRWRSIAAEIERRGPSGMFRSARASIGQVGLRGTLARARGLAGRDEAREQFRRWVELNTPSAEALARLRVEADALAYRPLVSIVTPVFNTAPEWLAACVESVRRQVYERWELCLADDASTSPATLAALDACTSDPRIRVVRLESNQHISGASNAALDLASGDFVALLDHDDELTPDALFEIVRALNREPDADFLYSDEDKLDEAGNRCDPYFKPDWSPEMFRSFMYTNHLMVLRRSLVEEVGRFRKGFEGSQDYDLALRVVERTQRVVHVPKILYHWRKVPGSAAAELTAKTWGLEAARRALVEHLARTGTRAEVTPGFAPGIFRVRHAIERPGLVSLVVTTDDRTRQVEGREVRLLVNCLRSVTRNTAPGVDYEILVVDNGRLSDETSAFLAGVPHRRVSYSYSGAFNFAHKMNFSARHARGVHLVILNDDIEVIDGEWLSALLEFSQQPEIGAVGAKLLFPDGRLQHVGMVLGVCGVAAHAFHMAPGDHPGYAGGANLVRNYSAVTGACLMTRREVFESVGGFNERLAIDFNDVDYCLRVRAAGYRVVYTPHARLYHLEAGTTGRREQARAELDEMRATWADVIERDPYYNPNLTRDFPDHRIEARPGR
jgi:GT2 family glycosyltransferase